MNVKKMVNLQLNIFNMLKNSKEKDKLSHAYLFYGPDGTGKKEMAYALACLLYDADLDSDLANSIINGKHLNVEYIEKEEGKTVISKEQILDLQEEFSKTSLVEGKRIYIVNGIDEASLGAQNSLLKFIEEPTGEFIGIFIAKELSNVVSTIQSRCELVYFKPINEEDFITELKNNWIDDLDCGLLSSLTNSIDEAMEIVNTEEYKKAKQIFLEFIDLQGDYQGVVFYQKYKDILNDNAMLNMLIDFMLLFLRDINLASKDNNKLILAPLYDKIISMKMKNKSGYKKKYENILNLINKLRYNVSPKNVFFELVLFYVN